jgi:hypothetical protein
MSADAPPDAYRSAVAQVGAATLAALEGMEAAERQLHPPQIPRLRQLLGVAIARGSARSVHRARARRRGAADVSRSPAQGAAKRSTRCTFRRSGRACTEATVRCSAASARHRRAQATLYSLRSVLPALGAYYRTRAARAHGELRSRAAGGCASAMEAPGRTA